MVNSWSVTSQKVQSAIQKIIEFSKPRKIIIFGSYVRNNVGMNSDLDVLVITSDNTINPRNESVRIRRALKGIHMPMDILVISKDKLDELADTPGLIYREAIKSGRIVYESFE